MSAVSSLKNKTSYWNGDKIRFTGKSQLLYGGIFHEFVFMEGHLKGKTGVAKDGSLAARPDSPARNPARRTAEPSTDLKRKIEALRAHFPAESVSEIAAVFAKMQAARLDKLRREKNRLKARAQRNEKAQRENARYRNRFGVQGEGKVPADPDDFAIWSGFMEQNQGGFLNRAEREALADAALQQVAKYHANRWDKIGIVGKAGTVQARLLNPARPRKAGTQQAGFDFGHRTGTPPTRQHTAPAPRSHKYPAAPAGLGSAEAKIWIDVFHTHRNEGSWSTQRATDAANEAIVEYRHQKKLGTAAATKWYEDLVKTHNDFRDSGGRKSFTVLSIVIDLIAQQLSIAGNTSARKKPLGYAEGYNAVLMRMYEGCNNAKNGMIEQGRIEAGRQEGIQAADLWLDRETRAIGGAKTKNQLEILVGKCAQVIATVHAYPPDSDPRQRAYIAAYLDHLSFIHRQLIAALRVAAAEAADFAKVQAAAAARAAEAIENERIRREKDRVANEDKLRVAGERRAMDWFTAQKRGVDPASADQLLMLVVAIEKQINLLRKKARVAKLFNDIVSFQWEYKELERILVEVKSDHNDQHIRENLFRAKAAAQTDDRPPDVIAKAFVQNWFNDYRSIHGKPEKQKSFDVLILAIDTKIASEDALAKHAHTARARALHQATSAAFLRLFKQVKDAQFRAQVAEQLKRDQAKAAKAAAQVNSNVRQLHEQFVKRLTAYAKKNQISPDALFLAARNVSNSCGALFDKNTEQAWATYANELNREFKFAVRGIPPRHPAKWAYTAAVKRYREAKAQYRPRTPPPRQPRAYQPVTAPKVLYFQGIRDPAELKKRYRELAFQLHPDRGGDPAAFREMAAQYNALKPRVPNPRFKKVR